jgi:U4/U6 small nuclear ribonucleoprotein PRP4
LDFILLIKGVEDLNPVTVLKGHSERVNAINFHPHFLQDIPMMGPNIATGSNDFDLKLWSFNSELKSQKCATFKGHEDKINCVEFHPMGKLIASGSNDKTWILWDLETKKDLLIQEGHASFVTCLSFQNDGALLVI